MKKALLSLIAGLSMAGMGFGMNFYDEEAPKTTRIISQAASDLTTICNDLVQYSNVQDKLPLKERYLLRHVGYYPSTTQEVPFNAPFYYVKFKDNDSTIEFLLFTDKNTLMDYRDSLASYELTPEDLYEPTDESCIGICLRLSSKANILTIEDHGADGIGKKNPANSLRIGEYMEDIESGQRAFVMTPDSPLEYRTECNVIYAKALTELKHLLEKKLEKLKKQ